MQHSSQAYLAALLFLVALCSPFAAAQPSYSGFMRVSNGRFVDANCREFLFNGWNGWKLLDYAANKVTPSGYSSGQQFIQELFKRANASGLNLLRFFTIGDDDNAVVLMQSPGSFNEEAFKGLDFVLDQAAKAGIKLVMVPSNLWKQNGGVPQFEEWCGTNQNNMTPVSDVDVRSGPMNATDRLQTPIQWYNNTGCRQMYKNYLQGIVSRRNSINGLLYKEDPTIFAWNLLNEPRCKYCGPGPVNDWYHDMANFMKSIDPNHMVTTGEEGFFDATSPFLYANPYKGANPTWAGHAGQDFVLNHDSPNVDYAVMHLWPDNWGGMDLSFGRTWMTAHIQAAERLGKPLMLEEFGKNANESEIATVRDPWFELVYGMVNDSLSGNGVLRGALFWQWDGFGNGPRKDGGSNIRETDSTFMNYIVPFSHRVAAAGQEMHKVASDIVQGCTPALFNGPPAPPVKATQGSVPLLLPGTGSQVGGRKLMLA